MSSKLLGAAWDHLPWSGGMMILALKLVDNAHDDGRHIFPSIADLAAKTKQSDRTVQRQLRQMEASGWLVCEIRSNGGRNRSSRYRIAAGWVASPASFEFRRGAAADAALPALVVPTHDDPASVPVPERDPALYDPARETVTPARSKPRQNVAVSHDSAPPQTVTLATETVTPVSGAYNPQEPLIPPLTSPQDAKQAAAQSGKRRQRRLDLSADPAMQSAAEADRKLAQWIFGKVLAVAPSHAPLAEPTWRRWCNDLRLMRTQDRRTHREIAELFRWANTHPFWHPNILSPGRLRKQWPQLVAQRERDAALARGGARLGGGIGSVSVAPLATPDRGCRWLTAGGLRCTCRGTRSDGAHLDAPWYCDEHWESLDRQRASEVRA